MVAIDFSNIELRLKKEQGKTYVFDPVRKKWIVLTPEEHVRQYLLQHFIKNMNYPASLIAVEKNIKSGSLNKRFDIAVYNRNHQPWLLVECKAPEVTIDQSTLNQLLKYHNELQCSYWLISNGHQNFCADACSIESIKWITQLPDYDQ